MPFRNFYAKMCLTRPAKTQTAAPAPGRARGYLPGRGELEGISPGGRAAGPRPTPPRVSGPHLSWIIQIGRYRLPRHCAVILWIHSVNLSRVVHTYTGPDVSPAVVPSKSITIETKRAPNSKFPLIRC